MSRENVTPKQSPFMSMFGRKKRVNGTKSADDIKGVAAALAINNNQTVANGFIDADHDSMKESSPLPSVPSVPSSAVPMSTNRSTVERHQQVTPANASFVDKVRQHKSARSKHAREAHETRHGSVPVQTSSLPGRSRKDKKDQNQLRVQQKAFSADAVYHVDTAYLMEALETLAEEQPRVARSIPKHAPVETTDFAQKSLDNCLFDASVYDNMLCDSLKVCEMLQNHLDRCIVTVRAKSPEGRSLGRVVEEDTEEESSSAVDSTSQQTVLESPRQSTDLKRISTLTNDTSASSIDLDVRASNTHHPHKAETRKLKSIVQYQC